MDPAKFYEHVPHRVLKQEGEQLDVPKELPRLSRVSYRTPRRAKWGVVIGEELVANGTLAAGCSCATGLAKVAMHRAPVTLARAHARW